MSRNPSFLSHSRTHTSELIPTDHTISLVDQEEQPSGRASTEEPDPHQQEARRASDATASQPPTPGPTLSKRLTNNSLQLRQGLQRKLTERRYAKYTQANYDLGDVPPEEEPSAQPQHGEPANPLQVNYLERGRAKAKALLKRKKRLGQGKDTEDTVLDILYENQRGIFLFGLPKYSASSLLPSDPKPWQNARFRTSPVDIRNAQVPDPSWEWVWKSWYVDMSRDVDEEGWEYSFRFYGTSSWHGNHPWFHSFVRRRRWLRMRRRRDMHHHTREKSHEMTAEYFTIHPRAVRAESLTTNEIPILRVPTVEDPLLADLDLSSIYTLLEVLKVATVDREKLVAVRRFINEGSQDLYYLSERMSEIMTLLVYQSSRRQLIADLLSRIDEVRKIRESLKQHVHDDDEAAQKQHATADRRVSNLMRAVEAADEEAGKLEYWSDIKSMAQEGETLHEHEQRRSKWIDGKWMGLTSKTGAHKEAFSSKQKAEAGAPRLHRHAEHGPGRQSSDEDGQPELFKPDESSTLWFENGSRLLPDQEKGSGRSFGRQSLDSIGHRSVQRRASSDQPDDTHEKSAVREKKSKKRLRPTLERFVTPPESASEIENDDEDSGATNQASKGKDTKSKQAETEATDPNLATAESLFPGALPPKSLGIELPTAMPEANQEPEA